MSEEQPIAVKETPCAYIDDGYTLPFNVAEVPGISQGISGVRRPFTPRERSELVESLNKNHDNSDKRNKIACEAMHKHMVSWDLKTRDGRDVPLTPGNLGLIHPLDLWNRLFETVVGTIDDDTTEAQIINAIREEQDIDKVVVVIEKLLRDRREKAGPSALKN